MLTFFEFTFKHASLKPPIGHSQLHQALPKKMPDINRKIKTIILPETIPFIAPSIETYGER
jgi:hypothetical protein